MTFQTMRTSTVVWCALAIVLTPSIRSAAAGQSDHVALSVPGRDWEVRLTLPGFEVKKETWPDGRRYLLATKKDSGLNVSLTLEATDASANAASCEKSMRQRVQRSRFKLADVQFSKANEMELLEYMIPDIAGVPVKQQNLFGCMVRNHVFIDVHISKVAFQKGERPLLSNILDSLRVVQHTSLDLMREATEHYEKGDYAAAIPGYARALEMEKSNRALDRTLWYILVDNLGMAYGVTSDLQRAIETFQYGLSQDPKYPLFYYNLACAYAELGDVDGAIANLEKAFEHKANLLSGEQMPDPRKDSSFTGLLKDDKFRRAVDSLTKVN